MKVHLSIKNVVIGVLVAAVAGLATVVALDHTRSTAMQGAAVTASSTQPGWTGYTAATGHDFGMALFSRFAQDLGVTPAQLKADVMAGQTLDQIAGANDAHAKSDVLNYVRDELHQAVVRGAISDAQESSLLGDAQDVINQLFAAHLGKLGPSH
ncbi:MAG: hypothetical protein ABR498_05160 [Candidatus Dormibacteria bacterium]